MLGTLPVATTNVIFTRLCSRMTICPDQERTIQPGVWAVIHCTTTDTFLFGKRSTAVNKGGAWNFFGGRLDAGENPRTALVRELAEEAGLFINPASLTELDCIKNLKANVVGEETIARDMHYYLLKLDCEFVPRLNFEHDSFRWFRHDRLPSKFNRPTTLAIKGGILVKARGSSIQVAA